MSFIKNFILLSVLLLSIGHLKAESKVISCKYDFGNKEEVFGVGLIKKTVHISTARNGLKYTFHIEDIDNFKQTDDYVVIENEKGHRITFFLECK